MSCVVIEGPPNGKDVFFCSYFVHMGATVHIYLRSDELVPAAKHW